MNHLHLLVPDLFLPQEAVVHACGGLRLPALEKLLARGKQTALPATTLEDFLCERFGVDAVAPVRAAADGLEVADGYWLCADPVHLQVQPSQVTLLPEVQCTAAEATALCVTLNAHFVEEGLAFFAPSPQRWYVRAADKFPSVPLLQREKCVALVREQSGCNVIMTALRAAAWRDVKALQAQGEDAMRWRCVSNEMQMLLHGHAVNQARAAHGLPAINCVWLWGNGNAGTLRTGFDAVGGDEALSVAFAQAAGIASSTTLQELLSSEGENGLWVCAAPSAAWQRGDLYAWREAVQVLERDVAQPVLHALRSGRLRAVTLDVLSEAATLRFALSHGGLWKLWRTNRSLVHYAT